MDFNTLSPTNQAKYIKLEKKMFGEKKYKLDSVCKKLNIPFYEGMMWWSHMLKNHPSPIPPTPVYSKKPTSAPEPAPALCPSCGRTKDAVSNTHQCRDVFHYV